MLIDKFGRQITYLRLAVTDRCNLRCQYCMPAEGIQYEARENVLRYEEILFLVNNLVSLGVNKIRLTGGEPFVRKDFIFLLQELDKIEGLEEINITTNGTLIYKHLEILKTLKKIKHINLSIDSLQEEKFFEITRRNSFQRVWKTYNQLLANDFSLKLNVVVLPGQNTNEIADFIRLGKKDKVSVRFIEEMPFNGTGERAVEEVWDKHKILAEIKNHFTDFESLKSAKTSTSENYKVKDYEGSFGIIPAFTRTICGGCNRIRITAKGDLKLCLFDDGIFNLRDQIRKGITGEDLQKLFQKLIDKKPQNGFVAEANRLKNPKVSESMSTIGG